MFILVYSDGELLSTYNKIEAFSTMKEAYYEMLSQFDGAAADDGLCINVPEGGGDIYGVDEYGLSVGFVGYIVPNEAYLEHTDEKWVIFEVPNAHIGKE